MAERDAPPAALPAPESVAPAHLELKAALLIVGVVLLIAVSVLYVLYARGAFEATQRLVLIAEDSEGVAVGMDVSFSGFPIGRVARIELADDGNARILVDVAQKDAHRLRTSSVFTLVRSLVGGTAIKAYSGVPTDPPLPDGAERTVLVGDATAEIPRLVADARALLQNLNNLTAEGAPLATTLANVQALTGRASEQGALAALLGNEADARKLGVTLDRTNALLARLDGIAAKADRQVFDPGGLLPASKDTVVQLRATLAEAQAALTGVRGTLAKVDGVLVEAQGVAANARVASTDLGNLRAEVEASLRKVQHLIDDINRRWPFSRDAKELKLP
jgi:phospholipid/cholesterol/gamma-HCH transport system substrate-binding protein